MDQLILVFSFFIITSCLMIINSINPIHSVFWMVLLFISYSLILLVLNLDFSPFIIIIIYIGAITILFLFVIMMVNIIQLKKLDSISHLTPSLLLLSFCLILNLFINYDLIRFKNSIDLNYFNTENLYNIQSLGLIVYLNYGFFIIISFMLLVSMIGVIILTLEKNPNSIKQIIFKQHKRNNSWMRI